jgi:hypothetical protein
METVMKAQEQKTCVQLLALAVFGATLSWPVLAQTDNATLAQEKTRLELEAAIEKSKADIAGYKKAQREAEALTDLGIRQKEAEARKAEADAEKGEVLAKIPPTKIEALPGSIDAKNFGAAGLIVAIDLAKALAPRLCGVIDQGQTALVYDATTISGITSARLLDTQLALFQDSLNKALQEKDDTKARSLFEMGIGMGAAVATGTIKAVADLASLFKTNITVSKTDFTEAKSLLLTAMANNCPEKLTSLGFGYMGELDTTEFDGLRTKALKLLNDRAQLESRITGIKKKLDDEKDAAKKKVLQTQFEDLSAVGKLVDGFIAVLRPNEINDKSPLPVAAKFLALSKRTANSNVFDIDLKLEGLTIIKENIFTGQKLRLSATAITWYRLHEKAGKVVKAGVWREIAKPVQVDLRGDDADNAFWSK